MSKSIFHSHKQTEKMVFRTFKLACPSDMHIVKLRACFLIDRAETVWNLCHKPVSVSLV